MRGIRPALFAICALSAPDISAQAANPPVRVCRPTNPPQCEPVIRSPGADSLRAREGNPYFEFMVDKPAAPHPESAQPSYPPDLRLAKVEGRVVAQFVVDTTGRVESGSFKLIIVSHHLFGESVRAIEAGLLYVPAELRGVKVRQLVQQEFRFNPDPPPP